MSAELCVIIYHEGRGGLDGAKQNLSAIYDYNEMNERVNATNLSARHYNYVIWYIITVGSILISFLCTMLV